MAFIKIEPISFEKTPSLRLRRRFARRREKAISSGVHPAIVRAMSYIHPVSIRASTGLYPVLIRRSFE